MSEHERTDAELFREAGSAIIHKALQVAEMINRLSVLSEDRNKPAQAMRAAMAMLPNHYGALLSLDSILEELSGGEGFDPDWTHKVIARVSARLALEGYPVGAANKAAEP